MDYWSIFDFFENFRVILMKIDDFKVQTNWKKPLFYESNFVNIILILYFKVYIIKS
jgi:hypothetical protein